MSFNSSYSSLKGLVGKPTKFCKSCVTNFPDEDLQ